MSDFGFDFCHGHGFGSSSFVATTAADDLIDRHNEFPIEVDRRRSGEKRSFAESARKRRYLLFCRARRCLDFRPKKWQQTRKKAALRRNGVSTTVGPLEAPSAASLPPSLPLNPFLPLFPETRLSGVNSLKHKAATNWLLM